MAALVDILLVVGIVLLAVKGFAYRGVFIALVPLGILWFMFLGLAAHWPTLDNEPAAQKLGTEIAVLGAAAAVGGFFGGILFRKKGRAGTVTENREASEARPHIGEMKKCPECAESVRAEARKCRFCGFKFSEEMPKVADDSRLHEQTNPEAAQVVSLALGSEPGSDTKIPADRPILISPPMSMSRKVQITRGLICLAIGAIGLAWLLGRGWESPVSERTSTPALPSAATSSSTYVRTPQGNDADKTCGGPASRTNSVLPRPDRNELAKLLSWTPNYKQVEAACSSSPSNNYPNDSDVPVLHMMYVEEHKAQSDYQQCAAKALKNA